MTLNNLKFNSWEALLPGPSCSLDFLFSSIHSRNAVTDESRSAGTVSSQIRYNFSSSSRFNPNAERNPSPQFYVNLCRDFLMLELLSLVLLRPSKILHPGRRPSGPHAMPLTVKEDNLLRVALQSFRFSVFGWCNLLQSEILLAISSRIRLHQHRRRILFFFETWSSLSIFQSFSPILQK